MTETSYLIYLVIARREMDNKIRHTEIFKIGFYKMFCNIALLISVAALMVCRSRSQVLAQLFQLPAWVFLWILGM